MNQLLSPKKHSALWALGTLVLALVMILAMLQMPVQAAEAKTATKYSFKTKIEQYNAINSDVQGWIYVAGTNINYPVVFYPDDVNYYIDKGYDKKYSYNGVIWADRYSKGGTTSEMSKNTVMYGHNWTNYSANPRIGNAGDVMFAQLPAFHHLDFAKEHQFINYSYGENNYVFQVFAVFYTEESFLYNRSNFKKEQWDEVITGARERSLHNYDIEVNSDDKIITLSTCTRAFGQTSEQRFVVMGVMVPKGSEMVTVTANPNYKRPAL